MSSANSYSRAECAKWINNPLVNPRNNNTLEMGSDEYSEIWGACAAHDMFPTVRFGDEEEEYGGPDVTHFAYKTGKYLKEKIPPIIYNLQKVLDERKLGKLRKTIYKIVPREVVLDKIPTLEVYLNVLIFVLHNFYLPWAVYLFTSRAGRHLIGDLFYAPNRENVTNNIGLMVKNLLTENIPPETIVTFWNSIGLPIPAVYGTTAAGAVNTIANYMLTKKTGTEEWSSIPEVNEFVKQVLHYSTKTADNQPTSADIAQAMNIAGIRVPRQLGDRLDAEAVEKAVEIYNARKI